jgi:protein-tyrosine phosphatase
VCGLTDQGRRALADLRLAQVIDLRAAHEADAFPDELPDGVAYHLAPAIDVDHAAGGLLDMDMLPRLRGVHSDEDAARYDAMFTALYTTLPFGNAAYQRMFDALDAGGALPMLQHCSAGKDRTGVGCALLLLALGASRQTAIGDYMLSNSFRAEINRGYLSAMERAGLSKTAIDLVERMISTSADLIQGTLDAIDARYASFEDFLQAEYRVDAARLARWRAAHTV